VLFYLRVYLAARIDFYLLHFNLAAASVILFACQFGSDDFYLLHFIACQFGIVDFGSVDFYLLHFNLAASVILFARLFSRAH